MINWNSLQDDYNRILKFRHEKEVSEAYNFLKKLPIFQNWTKSAISTLGMKMKTKKYEPGQIISEES